MKIVLPWDPSAKTGPTRPCPDHVSIMEETEPTTPISEQKGGKPEPLPSHSRYPWYNGLSLAAGSRVWICSIMIFNETIAKEKIKILKIKK